jgi:plastocyanin
MKGKMLFLAVSALMLFTVHPPKLIAASQMTVTMMDNMFSPKAITVQTGAMVMWANMGTMMHTATADNGMFDSGAVNPGGNYTFTFNTPGTYSYYCRFHGGPGGVGMSGTIVVTGSANSSNVPISGANPGTIYSMPGGSSLYGNYNPVINYQSPYSGFVSGGPSGSSTSAIAPYYNSSSPYYSQTPSSNYNQNYYPSQTSPNYYPRKKHRRVNSYRIPSNYGSAYVSPGSNYNYSYPSLGMPMSSAGAYSSASAYSFSVSGP